MSTGATSLAVPREESRLVSRLRDYAQLSKARVTLLELVTALAGMYLAMGPAMPLGLVLATLLGAGALAASAIAYNQYIERRLDAQMQRTANRPLPSGRMAPGEAALFGVVALAFGMTLLVLAVNWTTAWLGLLSWFTYVAIYTPLKTRSTFNTTVGAVSGALPIVMGWTAGGGAMDLTALGLFAVLFFWQYPHFMAIAWLCKDDYAAAGYKMHAVVEPTGARAGAMAVVGAAMLLPSALLPVLNTPFSALSYAIVATLLSALLLVASVLFMTSRTERSARRLLRASLLYLPAWMLVLCLLGR